MHFPPYRGLQVEQAFDPLSALRRAIRSPETIKGLTHAEAIVVLTSLADAVTIMLRVRQDDVEDEDVEEGCTCGAPYVPELAEFEPECPIHNEDYDR